MNLWAKRIVRQLTVLAVALFFFSSCEDETSLLGFKNPNQKFKVAFIDFPVASSVLLIDSIATDNKGSSTVLVGQYNDPVAGSVKTEAFLQMLPSSTAKLDGSSVYDSVTFQSRLTFYAYGFSGNETIRFKIHEITQDSLDRSATTRYYYNTPGFQYDPTPLGEAVISVNYDSLRKQGALEANRQDTLLATASLDSVFGKRLFNLAFNDPDGIFSDAAKFVYEIKGLALSPSGGNGVLGLNSIVGFSNVTLYYHTRNTDGTVKDKLQKTFVFSGSNYDPNFTTINTDRSATELSSITGPYQGMQPQSGMRIVQNGSPAITKLDLSKFYENFADTVDYAVINRAELVINDVESPAGFNAHSLFYLKVMNANNDLFTNYRIPAEREAVVQNYIVTDADAKHYFVISDEPSSNPAPAALFYSSTEKNYSAFLTLFIQNLFTNKGDGVINENRIRFLGLYPGSPTIGSSVNRTVFNADNVKLRVYYTIPTTSSNSN